MKKIILAACLVALLGSGPVVAQVDFTRYVALGDSLTAGYVGGGLTQFYQERSYPAMLAQSAQASDFQMPLVSAPGIPPILELVQLAPTTIIRPSSDTPGYPLNAALVRPYNDLGVPGATIYDMLNTVGDINNLLAGNQDNVMHDLILRVPAVEVPPGSGNFVPFTAVAQAIALDPTFLTLWIGNNDILGAAVYATPIDGVTMTPIASFTAMYGAAMAALTSGTSADMVVFTIPDVTAIPFVTTIKPYLDVPGVGRVPLIGSNGLLPEDAYVTLGASSLLAQGIGIPVELGGTGLPLPEDLQVIQGQAVPGVVLRPAEIQVINGRVSEMNAVIRAAAAQYGVPVVDVNGIFGRIAAGDPWVVGGIELTAQFLVGGIFSYDGVHPQNIGQALIAVEAIKVINQFYGAQIPQVNMDDVLCIGGCSDQGPPAFAASKEALFSQEALQQVLQSFPLRLPELQSNSGTQSQ
jgi:lysophospholipase L1-like esterase